jgi:uncharacterized coiled-coil protein SlyX
MVIGWAGLVLAAAGAGAAEAEPAATELAQLKRALAEQQAAFEQQQQQLRALQERLDRLTGPAAAPPTAGASPEPPVPAGPGRRDGANAPELPRLSETVGGVLTPQGALVVEPSLEYAYTDNHRVFLDAYTFAPAVAVGLIDLRELDRHTFIGALAGRLGLTDRLELSGRLAYLYREDRQRSRPISVGADRDEIFSADGSGLGDLEVTARYQLNGGTGGWPIFVANLTGSLPTGRSPYDIDYEPARAGFPRELPTGVGYFSLQPGLTAIYPSDPAVFFGSLSYAYNAETDEDIGTIDPGDTVGASFGLGFALNERASFSIGYAHKHVFDTSADGGTLAGSSLNLGEFLLGYAYKFDRNLSLNLSLSLGATDDAQDVKMTLRMPFSLSLY